MKIGIFDPYLDDLGGGEKYMMTVASCLSKEHEVCVFWDNARDIEIIQQRFGLDLSKVTRCKNIFSPKVGIFEKLIATKTFDVIIFLSDGSIPLTLSKKLFLHIQQPIEAFENDSPIRKIKLARVNGIFCNSYFTKSLIEKKLDKEMVVIYPPVDIHAKKIKKENYILHVGRFRVKNVAIGDYKKQGFMIEAFKKMVNQGLNDWKFILAVSVKDEDLTEFTKMKQKAKGFPVEFYVNGSNDKLWDIYSQSKIYWHASGFREDLVKHPEYAEHFGIATVEAMGAGCVPVVINAGGQKEIVTQGENGLLWNSEKELLQKTERVINDHSLWKNLSENAIRRAKDFSGESFCIAISQLIQ